MLVEALQVQIKQATEDDTGPGVITGTSPIVTYFSRTTQVNAAQDESYEHPQLKAARELLEQVDAVMDRVRSRRGYADNDDGAESDNEEDGEDLPTIALRRMKGE